MEMDNFESKLIRTYAKYLLKCKDCRNVLLVPIPPRARSTESFNSENIQKELSWIINHDREFCCIMNFYKILADKYLQLSNIH